LSYGSSPTAAVAASTRHAVYATHKTVKRVGAPAGLWPLIFFVLMALLGYWYWISRHHTKASNSNDPHTVRAEPSSFAPPFKLPA